MIWKYLWFLRLIRSQILWTLLWFIAYICNERKKPEFQLQVSENKDVISHPSFWTPGFLSMKGPWQVLWRPVSPRLRILFWSDKAGSPPCLCSSLSKREKERFRERDLVFMEMKVYSSLLIVHWLEPCLMVIPTFKRNCIRGSVIRWLCAWLKLRSFTTKQEKERKNT